MPINPTPKQQAASRENGARSMGPKDTSRTRENGLGHGFTAALTPPAEGRERELYEELLEGLGAEFLPCGTAECLALEEIVALELRRIRIQDVQMAEMDLSEDGLKRMLLLSRYETDTLTKLDKRRKLLGELQTTRAARRGLALESALVQEQVAAAKRQCGEEAAVLARRSLGRELHDLMGLCPQAADQAAAGLLGQPTSSSAAGKRRVSGDAGGFRPFVAAGSGSVFASPPPPGDDCEGGGFGSGGGVRPAGIPRMIPGPVWAPWQGASPEQLEAWNDELIAERRAELKAALAELEEATEPPQELVAMFPEHYKTAAGAGGGDCKQS